MELVYPQLFKSTTIPEKKTTQQMKQTIIFQTNTDKLTMGNRPNITEA